MKHSSRIGDMRALDLTTNNKPLAWKNWLTKPIDDTHQILNIASQCEFATLEDSLLRDILSWNLNDTNRTTKEKILQDKPKTLDDAVDIAKSVKDTRKQAKVLQDSIVVGRIRSTSRKKMQMPQYVCKRMLSRGLSQERQVTRTQSHINKDINVPL
ncbi:hypothetical protein ACJJTC_003578 [Scirpophaga incertulas]